jgi:glycosyltransferase involved in cell wall biosynthesis
MTKSAADCEGQTEKDGAPTLDGLFSTHQGNVSDKWSIYINAYERLFQEFQSKPIRLLEIGTQNGGSLEIWRKYFASAEAIVGCDINPNCAKISFDDANISVVVGDANEKDVAEQIQAISPDFDIIIDDGSHKSSDIVRSFARYFDRVRDGGIYIVEDMHCSYWRAFEGGLHHPYSSLEFFKRLLDAVNVEHWGNDRRPSDHLAAFSKEYAVSFDDEVLASIHSIQFLNSLCVIRRRSAEQNVLGARRVAGLKAIVNPSILELDGSAAPKCDETENPWTLDAADPQNVLRAKAQLSAALLQRLGELTQAMKQLVEAKQLLAASEIERLRIRSALEMAEEKVAALKNATIATQEAADAARQATSLLEQKESELFQYRQIIDSLYGSTSWRLTAPVRAVKLGAVWAKDMPARARYHSGVAARWIWPRLPLSVSARRRLKDVLFTTLPFAFSNRQAFQSWKLLREFGFSTDETALEVLSSPVDEHEHAYVPLRPASAPAKVPAKLICFYLPQFHPIPENDAWWGEGFTEWTNVRPARPQFEGHYQPRIPGELGYYDLLDSSVQRRQIELAKLYGIGGFCFYLYWFGGKRLLEKPVENYLNDPTLDHPYCLCWANENWSRRWDGLDAEILIAQDHSPQDDIAFIEEVAAHLRDPRYIRIDGRPLLIVYRPNLLPSAAATSQRWRKWCRENGIGEIFLAYTQSFEIEDPGIYGFDAAIEFPPNNSAPPIITNTVRPITQECQVTVYDWRVFPLRSAQYTRPRYTLFRGVTPSWDNTARRKSRGTVFFHNTPDLYRRWLKNAIEDTCAHTANPDERLIFVNAWNEWAEGAYLEPDARYGYAYLQATRDALEETSGLLRKRIVIVAHDAHPHGAQFLSLNLARHFRKDLDFEVDLISLGEGPLLNAYAEAANLYRIDTRVDAHAEIMGRLSALRRQGAEVAIVNTTVSGALAPFLKEAGFRIVSLIHELPGILEAYHLQSQASNILQHSDAVVFAADVVREGFEKFTGQRVERAKIRPQGLYLRNQVRLPDELQAAREAVRSELGLPAEAKIVLSVGYADHRKGVDLFVDVLMEAMLKDPAVFGVWVGHADQVLLAEQLARIKEANLADRFRFTGRVAEPQRFYSAADVFALTAREDPFPSVVLESLDAGTPVVAFKGAGGFESLLNRNCGVLVEAFDTGAMAREILDLLSDEKRVNGLGENGRVIVDREFSLRHYLFDLLQFAGRPHPKVSVVVPSYNYAGFIRDRLRTIIQQTYPIYELIILDDASTDDSALVIEEVLKDCEVPHVFIRNAHNSGSVFHQWQRGVEEARGDLVWIAEADDLSDADFIENVVQAFDNPDTVMSFAQSRQMAADGSILCGHYLDYVADIDPVKWTAPYVVSGREEISRALFVKNTIPNVSAVLFRRDALRAALDANKDEVLSYRNAGDWVTYLRILENGGSIAFCPRALNSHRRHQQSVTVGNFNLRQLQEIVRVQRDTIQRFSLGADAEARADAYAQKLYEQFGLATAAHPAFSDHPELKTLVGSLSSRQIDGDRGNSIR